MTHDERRHNAVPAPGQGARAGLLTVLVSPLTEFEELTAFEQTLAGVAGIQAAELVEYDFPTATFAVQTAHPEVVSLNLAHWPGVAAARLPADDVLELRLRPAAAAPVPPAAPPPAEPAAPAVPARARNGRRSVLLTPWPWVGLLAVVVAAAATTAAVRTGRQTTSRATTREVRTTPRPFSTTTTLRQAPATPAQGAVTVPARVPSATATPAAAVARTPTATARAVTTPAPATVATATPRPPAVAPSAPTRAQGPVTVDAVLATLQARGLPIARSTTDPALTDPEGLLGQPGQYVSKLSFQDARLPVVGSPFAVTNGGAVEVFASAADADRRRHDLELRGTVVPAVGEYDYGNGSILLRLSRRLTSNQAQQYAAALMAVQPTAP